MTAAVSQTTSVIKFLASGAPVVLGQTDDIISAVTKIGLAAEGVETIANAAINTLLGQYAALIESNIELNSQIGRTAAVIISNTRLFDIQGQQIEDFATQVNLLRPVLRDTLRQIEQDTQSLAGVTTREVQAIFGTVTQQITALIGQSREYGNEIESARILTGSFAASLGALGLQGEQVAQEIRATLRGEIGPDSDLAQALNISRTDIEGARARGELVDFLVDRLSALRSASELAAQTSIPGITSNIADEFQIAAQELGEPLFDALIPVLQEVLEITRNLRAEYQDNLAPVFREFARVGGDSFRALVDFLQTAEQETEIFSNTFEGTLAIISGVTRALDVINGSISRFTEFVVELRDDLSFLRFDEQFLNGPSEARQGFAGLVEIADSASESFERLNGAARGGDVQAFSRQLQNIGVDTSQLGTEGIQQLQGLLNELSTSGSLTADEFRRLGRQLNSLEIPDQLKNDLRSDLLDRLRNFSPEEEALRRLGDIGKALDNLQRPINAVLRIPAQGLSAITTQLENIFDLIGLDAISDLAGDLQERFQGIADLSINSDEIANTFETQGDALIDQAQNFQTRFAAELEAVRNGTADEQTVNFITSQAQSILQDLTDFQTTIEQSGDVLGAANQERVDRVLAGLDVIQGQFEDENTAIGAALVTVAAGLNTDLGSIREAVDNSFANNLATATREGGRTVQEVEQAAQALIELGQIQINNGRSAEAVAGDLLDVLNNTTISERARLQVLQGIIDLRVQEVDTAQRLLQVQLETNQADNRLQFVQRITEADSDRLFSLNRQLQVLLAQGASQEEILVIQSQLDEITNDSVSASQQQLQNASNEVALAGRQLDAAQQRLEAIQQAVNEIGAEQVTTEQITQLREAELEVSNALVAAAEARNAEETALRDVIRNQVDLESQRMALDTQRGSNVLQLQVEANQQIVQSLQTQNSLLSSQQQLLNAQAALEAGRIQNQIADAQEALSFVQGGGNVSLVRDLVGNVDDIGDIQDVIQSLQEEAAAQQFETAQQQLNLREQALEVELEIAEVQQNSNIAEQELRALELQQQRAEIEGQIAVVQSQFADDPQRRQIELESLETQLQLVEGRVNLQEDAVDLAREESLATAEIANNRREALRLERENLEQNRQAEQDREKEKEDLEEINGLRQQASGGQSRTFNFRSGSNEARDFRRSREVFGDIINRTQRRTIRGGVEVDQRARLQQTARALRTGGDFARLRASQLGLIPQQIQQQNLSNEQLAAAISQLSSSVQNISRGSGQPTVNVRLVGATGVNRGAAVGAGF